MASINGIASGTSYPVSSSSGVPATTKVAGTTAKADDPGQAATTPASAPAAGGSAGTTASSGSKALTPRQQQQVTQLQALDRSVRAHEAAHQAAGGGYTGGATFTYTTGPDGHQYATGGEVPIDASSVPNDPQATIAKLRTVVSAALAPSNPSAQDRQVAGDAQSRIVAAQQQENSQNQAERNPGEKGTSGGSGGGSGGAYSPAVSARAAAAYRKTQATVQTSAAAGTAPGAGAVTGLASAGLGRVLSVSA